MSNLGAGTRAPAPVAPPPLAGTMRLSSVSSDVVASLSCLCVMCGSRPMVVSVPMPASRGAARNEIRTSACPTKSRGPAPTAAPPGARTEQPRNTSTYSRTLAPAPTATPPGSAPSGRFTSPRVPRAVVPPLATAASRPTIVAGAMAAADAWSRARGTNFHIHRFTELSAWGSRTLVHSTTMEK